MTDGIITASIVTFFIRSSDTGDRLREMDDRIADALFLLILTISVLVPIHMVARTFLSGMPCIIISLVVTVAIMVPLYILLRKVPEDD